MPLRNAKEFYNIATKKRETDRLQIRGQANFLAEKIMPRIQSIAEQGGYVTNIDELEAIILPIDNSKRESVYWETVALFKEAGFDIKMDVNKSSGKVYLEIGWKSANDKLKL